MTEYRAPLRDIRHVLSSIVDIDDLGQHFGGLDLDTSMGILEEAGRFIVDQVAPLNRVGDTVGSVLNDDGTVTTPPGFAEAYKAFVEAGWGGIGFPEEYGGGAMPGTMGIAVQEMLTSASMGFSLCPLLTQGAIDMLLHHGSEQQRETYLAKMISGQWSGTMNLTEPDAGSDVGALRTKAVKADDGTYRITGTKIYITFGEHDMAENIVHLVLARTPDAPPGTKGISCFIVPKFILDADGNPGVRNDAKVVSIEHKLGIHASPTCVMAFGEEDGAVGYLIGEENQGMRYMFTMMNNARLSVGLEGLCISERAFQQAYQYATERVQGRTVGAEKGSSNAIIDHPDVRRMLLTMRAQIDAMRAICYYDSAAVDRSLVGDNEADRQAAADLAQLLTPITKGWCTDVGCEVTSTAIQIYGGMGYVEETGVAQHFRDARIAPIYEGTNGIQALDLVMRKLPMNGGAVIGGYLADMAKTTTALQSAGGELAAIGASLESAVATLTEATTWLGENGMADPVQAMAGATPYLEMMGIVTGGWLLGRSALAAQAAIDAGTDDPSFFEAKIGSAAFFAAHLLPRAAGLLAAVTAGRDVLFRLDADQLAS